ncbi:replication initiation protein [Hymenobacter defluvii]|uniref:Replication initiation protein n=1 Tax=Hymenobacter defluvii TaxID=2054411 RepID=A0ABS3THF4_9BACT|nr:replication initiation protein [Hymenobacter defluvii]MBO3273082.1 replication initiation protein [Hymenobacter defluvii]
MIGNLSAGNKDVYQHNYLIRTPLKMGELEARIFNLALRCVHQSQTELPPIEMKLTDVVPNYGAKAYPLVRAACDALYNQSLDLRTIGSNGKRRDYSTRLVYQLALDEGTGYIRGSFAPSIKPYLLELKQVGEFTRADVIKVLGLNNPHAQRLYWILKSWESPTKETVKEISLAELQAYLFDTASPYPLWADFNRFVLKIADKCFQRVGFRVKMEPRKTGKKVTSVVFTIPLLPDEAEATAEPVQEPVKGQLTLSMVGGEPTDKFTQLFQVLSTRYEVAEWQLGLIMQVVGKDPVKYDKVKEIISRTNGGRAELKMPVGAHVWSELKHAFPSLQKAKEAKYPKK